MTTKKASLINVEAWLDSSIREIKAMEQNANLVLAIERLRQAQDWIRSYRRESNILRRGEK